MNRINPIYIGVFLLVVLAVLVGNLNSAKIELAQAKELYASTAELSNELSGLKNIYSAKNKTKSTLQKTLRHTLLRSASIEQKVKSSSMTISSDDMDIKALNFLMGKLYNGAYNISTLTIKKLSENKVSLYAEIKW